MVKSHRFRRLLSQHILVPVTRGEITLEMVIDTGASLSILTPRAQDALGLAGLVGEPVEGKGAGGDIEGVHVIEVDGVEILGRPYEVLQFAITDLSAIEAKLGESVMGIVGANVLKQHVLEVDFSRSLVALHEASTAVNVEGCGRAGVGSFEVEGLLKVQAELDGVAVDAVFDLGASRSVINGAASELLMLQALDEEHPPLLGADNQAIGAGSVLCESVVLGGVELGPGLLAVADLPVFEVLEMAKGPAMILGIDLLATRRMVLSYEEGTLYLA